MRVVIRADASIRIGTGHIMRCLALGDKLRSLGADVRFICRELKGHLADFIRSRGFEVHLLSVASTVLHALTKSGPISEREAETGNPSMEAFRQTAAAAYRSASSPQAAHSARLEVPWQQDAEETIACLRSQGLFPNVLIIDHYSLDIHYERALRLYVGRILVIDDVADRRHDCDWLLDHNYDTSMETRYLGLVPFTCRLLLGPDYALLRESFHAARRRVRRSGSVRKLLISFGGADATGETLKALRALERWRGEPITADVIIGKLNPYAVAIRDQCRRMPDCEWYDFVTDMEERMLQADLAIGSGGTTSWERCCLGLPSLVVKAAPNQVRLTEQLAQTGAVIDLGTSRQVTPEHIARSLLHIQRDAELYKRMVIRSFELVDGKGAERVSKELISYAI